MSNIVDFWKWKRARLGNREVVPISRRARPRTRIDTKHGAGFISIGNVSSELLRLLTEE